MSAIRIVNIIDDHLNKVSQTHLLHGHTHNDTHILRSEECQARMISTKKMYTHNRRTPGRPTLVFLIRITDFCISVVHAMISAPYGAQEPGNRVSATQLMCSWKQYKRCRDDSRPSWPADAPPPPLPQLLPAPQLLWAFRQPSYAAMLCRSFRYRPI